MVAGLQLICRMCLQGLKCRRSKNTEISKFYHHLFFVFFIDFSVPIQASKDMAVLVIIVRFVNESSNSGSFHMNIDECVCTPEREFHKILCTGRFCSFCEGKGKRESAFPNSLSSFVNCPSSSRSSQRRCQCHDFVRVKSEGAREGLRIRMS